MGNLDGISPASAMQGKSELPAHVLRAAGFALRRGLPLVALCGPTCDHLNHGRRGHVSAARGKAPLYAGWTTSPIRRIEDLPPDTGNVGVICGFEVDALDIDDEAGLAWATATQPETPWRVMTGAHPRQHWYFRRRPGDVQTGMVLSLPDGKSLHFRGENSLVVAPHCQHWSGRAYTPVGDWGVPFSALPYFNRAEAEKIRGLVRQGDKRDEGRVRKAAAMSDGRLPPSGEWTDAQVRELLDGAWARMYTGKSSEAFRKARYRAFLANQTPCRAGTASAEAMNILRVGLAYLLLPENVVLDLAVASRWAADATEADGVKPWPWKREQLADRTQRVLRTSWRSAFGLWVSAAAPAPSVQAVNP